MIFKLLLIFSAETRRIYTEKRDFHVLQVILLNTMTLIKVYDEYVQFTKYRISNATICCIFGPIQLVISSAAMGQHIFSLVRYRSVFECGYGSTVERYLSSDIAIFDFGLFDRLWGITVCIANYLDGGYMRFLWCISHVLALVSMILVVGFIQKPRPFLMCPVISMQSFYSIGLLVLTLSALPRLLPMFFGAISKELVLPIFIYVLGVTMNCFLTYILWHYYWFLGDLHKNHKKKKSILKPESVKYPFPPASTLLAVDVQSAQLSTPV